MAKKSAIDKNLKRKQKIELRKNKRSVFSKMLKNDSVLAGDKLKLMKILDKTSHSSFIRYRNRCAITGRPRSYRGGVGVCRNVLRFYAAFGMIMGLKKMS